MLNHPCNLVMNPTSSWCAILFMYSWCKLLKPWGVLHLYASKILAFFFLVVFLFMFSKYQLSPNRLLCPLGFLLPFWFWLDDLSTGISGALKFPTIIVFLSISHFYQHLFNIFRCSYIGCIYVNKYNTLLYWSFYNYILSFFAFLYGLL